MQSSAMVHTMITGQRVSIEVHVPVGFSLDEHAAIDLEARLESTVLSTLGLNADDARPVEPDPTRNPGVCTTRRGVTRTVLLVGKWAIKIPSLRGGSVAAQTARGRMRSLAWGLDANLTEIEWSSMPNVCPVVWSLLGLVNVYRRCEPAPAGLTRADFDALGLPHLSDRKAENVGLLDGRLVWLDYA